MTKEKVINTFFTLLFLFGCVLIIISSYIYHKTFIHWTIPFGILLMTSFVITLRTDKIWDKYFIKANFILRLLYNVIATGSIFCYMFLAINYYNKSIIEKTIRYEIIDKSEIRSKGQSSTNLPRVIIFAEFGIKELFFNYPEKYNVSNCDSIDLTIRKGIFGFSVIDHYKFVDKRSKKNQLLIEKQTNSY